MKVGAEEGEEKNTVPVVFEPKRIVEGILSDLSGGKRNDGHTTSVCYGSET